MSDSVKAFWLGCFIIITAILAAWLLLFLHPSVGDCGHKLHVRFSNIQNISIGSRVTFGGKPVGEVIAITQIPHARDLPPDHAGNYYLYELELCVDSSVEVYSYDEIAFSTAGLMGEKSIAILPKAPLPGKPLAQNVTDTILYGRSTDPLQDTLTKLSDVGDVLEQAMQHLNQFLDENMQPFHHAVIAVGTAADSINDLVQQIDENHVLDKVGHAAEALGQTMDHLIATHAIENVSETFAHLARGEGTLGRMLTSDSVYLQLSAVLCRMDTVLKDISEYGLLFQCSSKWRRQQACKMKQIEMMCSPEQALYAFNSQIQDIACSVARIEALMCQRTCEDDVFAHGVNEILGRVENLLRSLKNYREYLFEQHCDACH